MCGGQEANKRTRANDGGKKTVHHYYNSFMLVEWQARSITFFFKDVPMSVFNMVFPCMLN